MSKVFPISYYGSQLGAVEVFQDNGVWHVRLIRNDRKEEAYSLYDLIRSANSKDVHLRMTMALIGFVCKEIEEYTNCTLFHTKEQIHVSNRHVDTIMVNSFLRFISLDNGPYFADWMLPWVLEGRIVFDKVPPESQLVFLLEDGAEVTVRGESSILFSRFIGKSIVDTSTLNFCSVWNANVSTLIAQNSLVHELNNVAGVSV